jgi:hypothetical protein
MDKIFNRVAKVGRNELTYKLLTINEENSVFHLPTVVPCALELPS